MVSRHWRGQSGRSTWACGDEGHNWWPRCWKTSDDHDQVHPQEQLKENPFLCLSRQSPGEELCD
jgi:hypothetical protein